MLDSNNDHAIPFRQMRAYTTRLALLAVLWWVLTEASGGWYAGLPMAAAAAAVSLWLTPPSRHVLHLHRIPGFIAYFLLQSLRAGWDVACRTLNPRLPMRPGILRVPLRLPTGAPTWWLMTTISLLPGTLSVRLDGNQLLEVHCLDVGRDVLGDLRDAEMQLADLFGQPRPDLKEGRN